MCQTCLRHDNAAEYLVPIVGMVCGDCRRKLERPTLLDGVISGSSMVDLCGKTVLEFHQRRERLQQQARQICEGAE